MGLASLKFPTSPFNLRFAKVGNFILQKWGKTSCKKQVCPVYGDHHSRDKARLLQDAATVEVERVFGWI
jgi:hypothetical protein